MVKLLNFFYSGHNAARYIEHSVHYEKEKTSQKRQKVYSQRKGEDSPADFGFQRTGGAN